MAKVTELAGAEKTRHEILFIKNIGSFSETKKTDAESEVLRKKYIKTIPNRVNWGGIDRDKIVEYVRSL